MRKKVIPILLIMCMLTALCGCGDKKPASMKDEVTPHFEAMIVQNAGGLIDDDIYTRYLNAASQELNDSGIKSDTGFASFMLSYLNQDNYEEFEINSVREDANGNYIVDVTLSRTSFLKDYKKALKKEKDSDMLRAAVLQKQRYGTVDNLQLTFWTDEDRYGLSDKSIGKIIDTIAVKDPRGID